MSDVDTITVSSGTVSQQASLEGLLGQTLVSAQSSLQSFGLIFDNGLGLLLEGVVEEGELAVGWKILSEAEMPRLSEAVCSVDWSWIYGCRVLALDAGESFRLTFDKVGKITVNVGAWQGKPFLSFMPYKPL